LNSFVECVGVTGEDAVYGQHHEWATLGFVRAIASNETISRCLIDKRWLHTLLTMINVPPASGPADDEDDDDGDDDDDEHCNEATCAHHLSLPKRVIDLVTWLDLILPASSFRRKLKTFYFSTSSHISSAPPHSSPQRLRFGEFLTDIVHFIN